MIRCVARLLAFLGATLCVTAATAGTYNLCVGEYWMDGRNDHANPNGTVCPAPTATQLYVYCGVDLKTTAAALTA
jgi:hypothetical protein